MDIDILLGYTFLINKLKLIFRRVSKLWHYRRKRKDVIIKPTNLYQNRVVRTQSIMVKHYLLNKYRHKKLMINHQIVYVNSKSAGKYTNPLEKIPNKNKQIKYELIPYIPKLLKNSFKVKWSHDGKNHAFAKDGWEYYKTYFQIKNNRYSAIINLAKNGNHLLFYDITDIKKEKANLD